MLEWVTDTVRRPRNRFLLVAGYTVLAVAILVFVDALPTGIRIPLALPVLLFAPGYAVVNALFPQTGRTTLGDSLFQPSQSTSRSEFHRFERPVLAVMLSIVVVPLVALVTDVTTGIRLGPLLALVAWVTVLTTGIAIYRLSGDWRGSGPHRTAGGTNEWSVGMPRKSTLFAVALTLSLVVSGVAIAPGGDQSPTTEFYVAGTDHAAGEYQLGIEQHGDVSQEYTVVAVQTQSDAVDPSVSTSLRVFDRDETVVRPDERTVETVRVDRSRVQQNATVRFLLYEGAAPVDPEPGTAYRELSVTVNGTAD